MSDIAETVQEILEEESLENVPATSGMDSNGNTFIHELKGYPIVNSKGLLRRKKGTRINIQNVTWTQRQWEDEKNILDILLVCIEVTPEQHIYIYGDAGYVCFVNRTAIRLAGYPLTVVKS